MTQTRSTIGALLYVTHITVRPVTGPDSRSREAKLRERRLHSLQDLATFTSTSLRTKTHKFRFDLFGVSKSAYYVGRSIAPLAVLMVLARNNVYL